MFDICYRESRGELTVYPQQRNIYKKWFVEFDGKQQYVTEKNIQFRGVSIEYGCHNNLQSRIERGRMVFVFTNNLNGKREYVFQYIHLVCKYTFSYGDQR